MWKFVVISKGKGGQRKMKNNNIFRMIIVIASIVIMVSLFSKCKMVAYAYTDEEKEAAKQWLIENGYSPDRNGANQAYQDYLNGKFDEKKPEDQDKKDDGSEKPDDKNNQDGSDTPGDQDDSNKPDDDQKKENQDGEQESDGTQNQNEDDSKKNKDSKNAKDSKNKKKSNQDGKQDQKQNQNENQNENQNQNVNGSSEDEQNIVENVGDIPLVSDLTKEQESDFMKFVATQVVKSNKPNINQEERDKRQQELYEQSLAKSDVISENDSAEYDDNDVQETEGSLDVEDESQSGVLRIWILISVVAVLVLGTVCFLVLRKR